MKYSLLIVLTCLLLPSNALAQNDATEPVTQSLMPMSNQKIDAILHAEAAMVEGKDGSWRALFGERILMVITDEANNRMRIIAPIAKEKEVKKSQYEEILRAQFHKALDIKYALFDGVIWSMFAHPLKELTEEQFKDALNQVYWGAENFGGSYKSTGLQFGAGDD